MSIYVDVNLSPLDFNFGISGSMPNINIDADSLDFGFNIKGVFSSYPAASRNPDLDIIYDCTGFDRFGDRDQGVLPFDMEISGSWLNVNIYPDDLDFDLSISGTFVDGTVIDTDSLDFSLSISGDFILGPVQTSWVYWSDIGNLDFKIDEDDSSNQAGERPMEWSGVIYDILKLNDGVIVYGSNGIAEMKPVSNAWSYRRVSSIGTRGRNAQISNHNNSKHWFIDAVGQLWEVGDGVSKLDYSEFLVGLFNPVISINEKDEVLYICDGTNGYVYSYNDKSLGEGPVDVTGYRYKDSTTYVTAPGSITIPTIEFTTGIYDFGSRKEKTIFNLEISTAASNVMQAAIDYRINIEDSFVQTPWVEFNPSGFAILPCYGREFRFKFKMADYESFKIDQFKVNGVIHGFSFLDTTRKER